MADATARLLGSLVHGDEYVRLTRRRSRQVRVTLQHGMPADTWRTEQLSSLVEFHSDRLGDAVVEIDSGEDGVLGYAVDLARGSARATGSHRGFSRPDGSPLAPERCAAPAGGGAGDWPAERLAELAAHLRQLTLSAHPLVSHVRRSVAAYASSEFAVYDSGGTARGYVTAESQGTVDAVGEHGGRSAVATGSTSAGPAGSLDLDHAASHAAATAAARVAPAAPAPAGGEVILAPFATARLLSRLWPAFGSARRSSRLSWLEEGMRVGSEDVTVAEDPTDDRGPGWAPVADDGSPARRIAFIRDGVVTAQTAGMAPSRAREGTGPQPAVPRNLLLATTSPSPPHRASGTYVHDFDGVRGGIDVHAGRLEVRCAASRIEDGELGGPVGDFVLATTVPRLLRSVRAVHGPVRYYRMNGSIGGATTVLDRP